ncbi:MAG: hypothetical protein IK134_12805 [Oscillospiraceae bacterium]|nr:hypothetical protein [Oscillospiraceae bacterium]
MNKKFLSVIGAAVLSLSAMTVTSVPASAAYDNNGGYHANARSNYATFTRYSFSSGFGWKSKYAASLKRPYYQSGQLIETGYVTAFYNYDVAYGHDKAYTQITGIRNDSGFDGSVTNMDNGATSWSSFTWGNSVVTTGSQKGIKTGSYVKFRGVVYW